MKIAFDLSPELAPAFRAAVEDFSATVAARLTKPHQAPTERAITQAVAAIGVLRAAVCAQVPKRSERYTA